MLRQRSPQHYGSRLDAAYGLNQRCGLVIQVRQLDHLDRLAEQTGQLRLSAIGNREGADVNDGRRAHRLPTRLAARSAATARCANSNTMASLNG